MYIVPEGQPMETVACRKDNTAPDLIDKVTLEHNNQF